MTLSDEQPTAMLAFIREHWPYDEDICCLVTPDGRPTEQYKRMAASDGLAYFLVNYTLDLIDADLPWEEQANAAIEFLDSARSDLKMLMYFLKRSMPEAA